MRNNPFIYEINTQIFLSSLSEKLGTRISLAGVPDSEWQAIKDMGFDYIWLMGAWKRSPRAREEALLNTNLKEGLDRILPGWTPDDIIGSPYAIQDYRLDPMLGEENDLPGLRAKLKSMGMGLVLDFIPNHVALDHQWVNLHTDWFVTGGITDAMANPHLFYLSDNNAYIAHGRDPNFPPWTDSLQLNIQSPCLRQALTDELLHVASMADGVRCDMAMLVLNNIFNKTWGSLLKQQPAASTEFWADITTAVKQAYPDFIFIAEAYWGLEPDLLSLGIDFVYNKALYDNLRYSPPAEIRNSIDTGKTILPRSVNFIENHDEPRAASELGTQRSQAAAIISSTLPGMRLYHDGQFQGRQIHLPVQLLRAPAEQANEATQRFYTRLLSICNIAAFHEGSWNTLEAGKSWEDNTTCSNILAWAWRHNSTLMIVAVNYSPLKSQARIRLPAPVHGGAPVTYTDELDGMQYNCPGDELNSLGLYVDLEPWHGHIISMPPV